MPALPSQQPAPAAACFPNQPSAINFSFPFLFFSPPLSRGSGSSSALCAPLASPERFISEKSLWPDSRRPGAHRPAYTWASLRGSPSRRVPPPPTPRRGAGPHWALWERPQSHQARSCGSGRGRGGWGGGPRGGSPWFRDLLGPARSAPGRAPTLPAAQPGGPGARPVLTQQTQQAERGPVPRHPAPRARAPAAQHRSRGDPGEMRRARDTAWPGRDARLPAPPPERGVGETRFFPSPPSSVLARPAPLLGCH